MLIRSNAAKRCLEPFKGIFTLKDQTHMGVSKNAKRPKLIERILEQKTE